MGLGEDLAPHLSQLPSMQMCSQNLDVRPAPQLGLRMPAGAGEDGFVMYSRVIDRGSQGRVPTEGWIFLLTPRYARDEIVERPMRCQYQMHRLF